MNLGDLLTLAHHCVCRHFGVLFHQPQPKVLEEEQLEFVLSREEFQHTRHTLFDLYYDQETNAVVMREQVYHFLKKDLPPPESLFILTQLMGYAFISQTHPEFFLREGYTDVGEKRVANCFEEGVALYMGIEASVYEGAAFPNVSYVRTVAEEEEGNTRFAWELWKNRDLREYAKIKEMEGRDWKEVGTAWLLDPTRELSQRVASAIGFHRIAQEEPRELGLVHLVRNPFTQISDFLYED